MRKRWLCTLGGLAGLALGLAPGDAGAGFVTTVVMSGLDNPHGLAFGPDGGLYVAEAGRGGAAPTGIVIEGVPQSFGTTGAVSRLLGGVQQRVVTGLPSLARTGGGSATGLYDIAFGSGGVLYGVVGLGTGAVEQRAALGGAAASLGQLVRLPLGGGSVLNLADLATYEATSNPDGRGLNSNPFGLLATPGGFVVADAGGNSILGVTAGGTISTLAVSPARPTPLPFGPPLIESVPTAIALGPDGAYYIGELTGAPFPSGFANVYRLDPLTGNLAVALTGFTNIVDLTFGPDGSLYVLQVSRDGLASPTGPVPGALLRADLSTGARTTILSDGLVFPTGVAVGPDSSIYVSNFGTSPGGGQVLQLTPVPEPSTFALLGLGLVGLVGYAWRRR